MMNDNNDNNCLKDLSKDDNNDISKDIISSLCYNVNKFENNEISNDIDQDDNNLDNKLNHNINKIEFIEDNDTSEKESNEILSEDDDISLLLDDMKKNDNQYSNGKNSNSENDNNYFKIPIKKRIEIRKNEIKDRKRKCMYPKDSIEEEDDEKREIGLNKRVVKIIK